MTDELAAARRPIRRLNAIGLSLAALLLVGGGAFASLASIDGAVVAKGRLVVAGAVKTVQHPTGGVVAEILVEEGERVAAGQLLIRLDRTMAEASLGIVGAKIDELTVRRARLDAELAGLDAMAIPADLAARGDAPAVAAAIAAERRLFEARRTGAEGQKRQLAEKIAQAREEITGLTAQKAAGEAQASLARGEAETLEPLFAKGLVTQVRLLSLKRSLAGYEGQLGQIEAEIAKARSAIAEAEIAILQVDQTAATEAARERREVLAALAEAEERRTAAADQLARVDIRAPEAGLVHELAVHTFGGVVAPGATLLSIVPTGEALVVDGRVAPSEIDRVTVGATATVRVLAGNQRLAGHVSGRVVRVAADLSHDERSGEPYFAVRTALGGGAEAALGGLDLVSGMPVDTFITTPARTPLEFLLEPLTEQIAHAWRER